VQEVRCSWCDTIFTARRSTARYCSNRCRVAEHRCRARIRIENQREARWCENCWENVICEWERPDKRFCSNACRQKYYRDCGGPPITFPPGFGEALASLAAQILDGSTQRTTPP
jgi:hypothetical protein